MSIAPGQLIGSYRVVEKIGEGGMGAVYRAEDTAIQRSVVLKVLGTAMAGDAEMLQRFRREGEMIAGLEHPHILPVYEFGQVQGDPYIAMRFMRGGSLFDRMHEGRTSREKLLRLFDQVAEALDFAHDRDVIHRDLKPANVLLDESGNAYLADFGLAKTMEGSRDLTATGGILGTPAYMSPEQARGEKLDRRSDIYAFAVMAFEALSGQYPFVASTPMEYIYKHLSEPPRSILTLAADLPAAVGEGLRWGCPPGGAPGAGCRRGRGSRRGTRAPRPARFLAGAGRGRRPVGSGVGAGRADLPREPVWPAGAYLPGGGVSALAGDRRSISLGRQLRRRHGRPSDGHRLRRLAGPLRPGIPELPGPYPARRPGPRGRLAGGGQRSGSDTDPDGPRFRGASRQIPASQCPHRHDSGRRVPMDRQ